MFPHRPRTDHDRLLDLSCAGAKRLSRWHPYAQSPAAQNAAGSCSFSLQQSNTNSPTAVIPTAPLLPAAKSAALSRRNALSSTFSTTGIALTRNVMPLEFVPVARAEPGLTAPRSAMPAAAELSQEDKSKVARLLVERAMNLLSSAWKSTETSTVRQCSQLVEPDAAPACSSSRPIDQRSECSQAAFEAIMHPYQSSSQHMPLNLFVHEVLRRSRTNFITLQTSLCYLEVVAAKLPSLVKEEAELIIERAQAPAHESDDSSTTPEAPSMPSPLLCPRRTFLAALLLASKFLQDRSYSNKAWAKLTGLPAREVGRCERALFACLEWRLWVGKESPAAPIDGLDNTAVVAIDQQYVPPAAREPLAPLRKTRSDASIGSSYEKAAATANRLRSHKTLPATIPELVPTPVSREASVSPEMLVGPSNWMDVVLCTALSPRSQSDGYESSSQSPGALSFTQSTASEYSDVATPPDMFYADGGASPSTSTSGPLSNDTHLQSKLEPLSSIADIPHVVGSSGWS